MSAVLDKLSNVVSDKYTATTGVTAIPTIISTIIDIILSLLSGCMPTPTPASATAGTPASNVITTVKTNPILAQVRIRQEMRKAGIYNTPNREAVVQTIMESAETATEADVTALRAECDWNM